MTVIPIVIGITIITILKRLKKRLEKLEMKRKNRNLLDRSTIKISFDTLKSPGDLKRVAVTQTSVKIYQLKLARKICNNNINKNNNGSLNLDQTTRPYNNE